MNSKVKIRKLIVKGFRGARKKIWLDFGNDSKSVVLFGNNGDGKSSFSDAIEWFFTDKIAYLQSEGCGRDDYFNRYMPPDDDAVVELDFNNNILDSRKILKRRGGYSFSNTSDNLKDYIRNSLKDSFILRHHTMREFVDKTKKQKLERVEEIIGFGVVKECRDNILKALNSLEEDRQFKSLQGQLNERKRDLVDSIGKDDFSETDVLHYADQLAKQCGPNFSITDDSSFKLVSETLNKKVKASDRGKELLMLDSINENISKLPEIRDILQKINILLILHNELAKQQETIKASVIEKLYESAIEAIENKLVKPGECPICKKRVEDTESLLKSLKNEIEEIKKVLTERNLIIQDAQSLNNKVSLYQTILNALLEDEVAMMFLTPKLVTNISTLLSQYNAILNDIQRSPEAVSLPPLIDDLQNVEEKVKETQQRIAQRKKT